MNVWRNRKCFNSEQLLDFFATSLITNIYTYTKQNCWYFRIRYIHIHNLYFLEIKEVLVLFDKISSFHLCEDNDSTAQSFVHYNCIPCFWCPPSLLDGTINIKYIYNINIRLVHSYKYCTSTCMCKVQIHWCNPMSIVLSYADLHLPHTIDIYACGLLCVLDVTWHSYLYICTFCDSWYKCT